MGSHSVTCHPTQVNTARLNTSQTGRYTRLTYPGGTEGWVDLVDLLHTKMVLPAHRLMVTHPSTNQAQCGFTTLIEANVLTTTLHRHLYTHSRDVPVWLGRCSQDIHWLRKIHNSYSSQPVMYNIDDSHSMTQPPYHTVLPVYSLVDVPV